MDKARRASIVAILVYIVVASIVTLSEIPYIPDTHRTFFVVLKLTVIWATLPFAIMLWKNFRPKLALNLCGIFFMLYPIVGQLYRPMYYVAFLQMVFLYAAIFPVSKTVCRLTLSVGSLAYLLLMYYNWDYYLEISKHPIFSDIFFSVVPTAMIAAIANTFYMSERIFHEDAISRFSQIGIHSARVIHDLKGLVAAPKLHLQFLQAKTNGANLNPEYTQILELISKDLDGLKNVLAELNLLSANSTGRREPLELSDVVGSVRQLLSKQLYGIEFKFGDSITLQSDRSIITSILVNLVLNAIQAHRENNTTSPVIEITGAKNSIFVKDNAGGFDPGVLIAVSEDHYFSTRKDGSGLGLMLTSHGMKTLGGKMLISTHEKGAQVELRFKLSRRLLS